MPRHAVARRRLLQALFRGLLLSAAAKSPAVLAQPSSKETQPMEHLTVRIGMRLDEVQRQSAVDLGLAALQDDSPIILERPVALRYAMPAQPLALPPTLMVWINQVAGVVVDLTLAPQQEPLPLGAARELAVALATQLLAAGWLPTSADAPPLPSEHVLAAAVLSRPERQLYQRNLGEWQSGSTRVTMSLKELLGDDARRPIRLTDVRFLVNLYFSDLALYAAQRKRLLERRASAGQADDQRMPISVWLPQR